MTLHDEISRAVAAERTGTPPSPPALDLAYLGARVALKRARQALNEGFDHFVETQGAKEVTFSPDRILEGLLREIEE